MMPVDGGTNGPTQLRIRDVEETFYVDVSCVVRKGQSSDSPPSFPYIRVA